MKFLNFFHCWYLIPLNCGQETWFVQFHLVHVPRFYHVMNKWSIWENNACVVGDNKDSVVARQNSNRRFVRFICILILLKSSLSLFMLCLVIFIAENRILEVFKCLFSLQFCIKKNFVFCGAFFRCIYACNDSRFLGDWSFILRKAIFHS